DVEDLGLGGRVSEPSLDRGVLDPGAERARPGEVRGRGRSQAEVMLSLPVDDVVLRLLAWHRMVADLVALEPVTREDLRSPLEGRGVELLIDRVAAAPERGVLFDGEAVDADVACARVDHGTEV